MLYFEKNCEVIYFRSLTLLFENTPKTISIGSLITENRSFKKIENSVRFGAFYFKNKKADIFNFQSVKYFGKRFLFLKIWNVRINYCGNYGLSNLLFCFTGHKLEQLNNRPKETAVNSLYIILKASIKRSVW